jgi:hypothetical protein
MTTTQILLLIAPLLLVQLGLMALAVRDLLAPGRTVRGSKPAWLLIIVFGELVGPVAYFLAGRRNA